MQRTADGRLRTTEWQDIQYKHGNKVGKYATHELQLLTQRINDAQINSSLSVYDPKSQRYSDRLQRQRENCTDDNFSDDDDALLLRKTDKYCSNTNKSNQVCKQISTIRKSKNNRSDNINDDSTHINNGSQDQDDQESILALLRRKRLQEYKQLQKKQEQLGLLRHIDAVNYVNEVTNASKRYWVVTLLIKPGESKCEALLSILRDVAQRQCEAKFVSVIANEAVPDLPQRVLPCVLLYRHGSPQQQLSGLQPWLTSKNELSVHYVQQILTRYNVLQSSYKDSSKIYDNE